MQDQNYRDCLKDSVNKLLNIWEMVFETTLNLVMSGEMMEWNDTIEEEEIYTFNKELLVACDDQNVQVLTKLLEDVEQAYSMLTNLNDLPDIYNDDHNPYND